MMELGKIGDSGSMWAPGQQVDRFQLQRILGQGGFGITYLAQDDRGQSCVIKTLRPDLPNFSDQQAKFRQEAFNLLRCEHPHIVKVQDVIQQEGISGIVMDFVAGDNLAVTVQVHPQRRWLEPEALGCIQQVGAALEMMHGKGLLHRDVKPLNIMMQAGTGKAILIDFGLA
jgi:eukaryotic-like serine/threonine-protein kinase